MDSLHNKPEQEPVAWMYSITGALFDTCPQDADDGEFLPLYTTSPQRTWSEGREQAFSEIAEKMKLMPWGSDTMHSFLIWLGEQK